MFTDIDLENSIKLQSKQSSQSNVFSLTLKNIDNLDKKFSEYLFMYPSNLILDFVLALFGHFFNR